MLYSGGIRFMSTRRRQNESGRRRISLFSVEADGITDEVLARLRALSFAFDVVEGDTDVFEGAVGTDAHPQQFTKYRRAAIPDLTLPVDVLQQLVVSGDTVSNVRGHSGHASEYNDASHKHLHTVTWLQTILGERRSASYNTAGDKVATKRSTSFLGNVPGSVPGCRLGLARFAKSTMRQYASPNQIVDGRSEYGLTASRGGVAA